jgi:hypothetical protein
MVVGLVLALLVPSAMAWSWDDTGHMLVAYVAYGGLKDNAKQRVNQLIAKMDTGPQSDTFVEAACWLDDVRKTDAYKHTASWHFISVPCGGQQPLGNNVLKALDLCKGRLLGSSSEVEKARMLRYLIHLVGDVHQPLHCVDRIGGNQFAVSGVPDASNLHSFWDGAHRYNVSPSGFVSAQSRLSRSLTASALNQLQTRAKSIMSKHTRASLKAKLEAKDFQHWIDESHEIACAVFNASTPHKLPSSYVKKARANADERIALAGYRLSDLLNEIFGQ